MYTTSFIHLFTCVIRTVDADESSDLFGQENVGFKKPLGVLRNPDFNKVL